jgi:hypothetical protein
MKGSFAKPKELRFLSLAVPFVLVSTVFWGCTAASIYRLDPAASDRVGEVNAVVCVENENISIKVLASGYGVGGGLVGALIDAGVESKRKKEAMKIVAPLREKTRDIDFRETLRHALLPMMKQLSWPQIVDLKAKSRSALITAADVKERSFLEIHSIYQLSPGAEVLEISTGFALYLQGSTKAAVVGSVRYSSERIGTLEENDEAIALWAQNDAAVYRQALNQGIGQTVKMLNAALPYAGGKSFLHPVSEIKKIKIRIAHGRGDYGIKQPGMNISGWIVEENENRIIFQSQFGGFISFPRSDIIVPAGR